MIFRIFFSFFFPDWNHLNVHKRSAWPGDASTLLLGAGSVIALVVAGLITSARGPLLLGAGSFIALMVAGLITSARGPLLLGAGSVIALMVAGLITSARGPLLLGAGSVHSSDGSWTHNLS